MLLASLPLEALSLNEKCITSLRDLATLLLCILLSFLSPTSGSDSNVPAQRGRQSYRQCDIRIDWGDMEIKERGDLSAEVELSFRQNDGEIVCCGARGLGCTEQKELWGWEIPSVGLFPTSFMLLDTNGSWYVDLIRSVPMLAAHPQVLSAKPTFLCRVLGSHEVFRSLTLQRE